MKPYFDNGQPRRITAEGKKEYTKLMNECKEYQRLIKIRLCRLLYYDSKPRPSLRALAQHFGINKDTAKKWIHDDESYNKIMNLQQEDAYFMDTFHTKMMKFLELDNEPLEEFQKRMEKYRRIALKESILGGDIIYDPEGKKEWYQDGLYRTEADYGYLFGHSIESVKKIDSLIIDVSKEIQREGKVPVKRNSE
ncbi:hypothetical protein HYW76_02480 [Candidatus Pacearchaeota archaeon]|nr:hypothetical protein [Candidatus Pacearchaeota archaeon]